MLRGSPGGRLFRRGDPEELARQATSMDLEELPKLSRAAREYFECRLSFAAMARRIDELYERLPPTS